MNNVETAFLTDIIQKQTLIFIYLITGIRFSGYLLSFDESMLMLTNSASPSNCQLVFRHAISTIQLATPTLSK
jgi:host factor-I protein